MARVLFLIPPYVPYASYVAPAYNEGTVVKKSGTYRNLVADVPIGPLSLSSYLKKHAAADVRLVDMNVVLNGMDSFEYGSFAELFLDVLSSPEIVEFAPTVIGISALFTPTYRNLLQLGETARRAFPDALVVAGGGVPTSMYREIFRDSRCFDALCHGEGERPLLELVKARDGRALLQSNPAWITREKLSDPQSFRFDFIEDLDEIPFLDFGLLDLKLYKPSSVLATFPLLEGKTRSIPVLTSRGCPHRCVFCASHAIHGRAMRYHSIGRLREDFRRLRDEFDAGTLVFFDDHLMSSKKRFLQIMDVLGEYQMSAFFASSLALYALDRPVLEALRRVGVDNLVLSVESGSNRVLRNVMHKPLNLSIVSRVLADCRDLGISADVTVLIGLPGETKQDIEETRLFLRTLDASWFRVNMATPLVGSEMLRVCLEKGYLTGDYVDCDYKRAIVETPDFTAEYIQEKAYALNLELNFVFNSDLRAKRFDKALRGFENCLRVKADHAFALYYAAVCARELGLAERFSQYKSRYEEAMAGSPFWRDYARTYGLGTLESCPTTGSSSSGAPVGTSTMI